MPWGRGLAGSLKQCRTIMQYARRFAQTVHDFGTKLCISIRWRSTATTFPTKMCNLPCKCIHIRVTGQLIPEHKLVCVYVSLRADMDKPVALVAIIEHVSRQSPFTLIDHIFSVAQSVPIIVVTMTKTSEPTELVGESVATPPATDPLEPKSATASGSPIPALARSKRSSGPTATDGIPDTPSTGESAGPLPAADRPDEKSTTAASGSTTTIQRKRIIYVRPFEGEIQAGDLQLITDELSTELADDEILCEALYIGIDAGLKSQVLHYPDGITMIGGQIARVVASRSRRFPVGAHIYGKFGWQTHTVTSGGAKGDHLSPYLLPADIFGGGSGQAGLSISMGLGCLGVTGNTALVALQEILKPRAGETLLVTSAAGGVGNLVGQLAKSRYNCRVVGICGTDAKCRWLLQQAQFDAAVCYRSPTFGADLRLATASGVDGLFDSVGGELFGQCVRRMNEHGRIAVNGSLAAINEPGLEAPQTCLDVHRYFVAQQLTMRGFCVWDYADRWMERITEVRAALTAGQLRNYETVLDGFERCPEALKALIRGDYRGRVVVKVTPQAEGVKMKDEQKKD